MKQKDFFGYIPRKLTKIFNEEELCWFPLIKLKDFIIETITPNLPNNIPLQQPLLRPIVLMPDGSTLEEFDICSATGKLRVLVDGEVIEDATILCSGAVFMDSNIEIGKSVIIEPGALIKGPTIIGNYTEIRQGAYIRGWSIFGSKCVIGHTTEVKHSIFLDNAKAGHFAYIGDSILGNNVNLGAGTKLANLPFASKTIAIPTKNEKIKKIDTGLRKLGAILGDNVQTGCNSVTNPGVLLGRDSFILPTCSVAPGYYPKHSIIRK